MKQLYEGAVALSTNQQPTISLEDLIASYERTVTVLIVGAIDRRYFRRIFRRRHYDDVLVFVESREVESDGENRSDPISDDDVPFVGEISLRPESIEVALEHLARFEHLDASWLSPAVAERWFGASSSQRYLLAEHVLGPSSAGSPADELELLAGGWPTEEMRYRNIESRHGEITGGRVGIEVGLTSKVYVHPERSERRSWLPGISLNSFLELGGCWPKRLTLSSLLDGMELEGPHGDLEPWNLVLDGRRLAPIDNQDGRGLDDARQSQVITAAIHQVKGYTVYDLPPLIPDTLRQSFALVVWPPAEERLEEIRAHVESCYRVTLSGSFGMSDDGWRSFLDELYKNVKPDPTAVAKREMLIRLPRRLHLITYLIPGEEAEVTGPRNGPPHVASGLVSNRYTAINELKESIRDRFLDDLDWQLAGLSNGDNYIGQFAVAHAADSLRQSRELVRGVARHGSRARFGSPIRYFGRFLAFLDRHGIDPDIVSIVDSAILAMLGLRTNRDLDFIVDPASDAFQQLEGGDIQPPSGLHWVRDWSRNRTIPDHLLIYSPRLYLRHHGIKIGRLEPLYFNKQDMGRPKDLVDLERIDSVRELFGWDPEVLGFFETGKPVVTQGSTQLRTLPDIEKIIERARKRGRQLKSRELKKIPSAYWHLRASSGEPLIPDHFFPEGEPVKRVWFDLESGGGYAQADFLQSQEMIRTDVSSETLSSDRLVSVPRQDVAELVQEKVLLVLHFHDPGEAAYSTLRYYTDTGFFSPERIVATVGGVGGGDFRRDCLKLYPGLRLVSREQFLSCIDQAALGEATGVRLKDEAGSWIYGKGLTDWCTGIAIAALGLKSEFVLFSDTDLHLVERYDPAFHLGAALLSCMGRNGKPCRIVPACSGRNNEPVVAAMHNLMSQARVSSVLGNTDHAAKLQDYHDVLSAQVWPIAGEHVVPFRIGDLSPVLDMPHPTGYGIEMFLSCFLADCARRAGQEIFISQPEILFPRIDQLNSHEKEVGTLHLMAVFMGLAAEYPKRIVDFGYSDLKTLNRSILPALDQLHMIAPRKHAKLFLPFNAGQILPSPCSVLKEGWVERGAVLSHLEG